MAPTVAPVTPLRVAVMRLLLLVVTGSVLFSVWRLQSLLTVIQPSGSSRDGRIVGSTGGRWRVDRGGPDGPGGLKVDQGAHHLLSIIAPSPFPLHAAAHRHPTVSSNSSSSSSSSSSSPSSIRVEPRTFFTSTIKSVAAFLLEEDRLWATYDIDSNTPRPSITAVMESMDVTCDTVPGVQQEACIEIVAKSQKHRRRLALARQASPPTSSRVHTSPAPASQGPPDQNLQTTPSSFPDGPASVRERMPQQSKTMHDLAQSRLSALRQPGIDVAGVVQRARRCKVPRSGVIDDTGAGAADRQSGAGDATIESRVATVRILSGTMLLPIRSWTPTQWQKLVFLSADILVVILDEIAVRLSGAQVGSTRGNTVAGGDGDGDGELLTLRLLASRFETTSVSSSCAFAAVHDVDEHVDFAVAVVIRCTGGGSQLRTPSPPPEMSRAVAPMVSPLCASANYSAHSGGAGLGGGICGATTDKLKVLSVIKWGTKTAVFKAQQGDQRVALKMFDIQQYAQFEGFFAMMRFSTRSPLINYPTSSCIAVWPSPSSSPAAVSVFQVQPFLHGKGSNLMQFMKSPDGKQLQWRQRVELSMEILCIFRHLHHEHPAGMLTFDDNHPEQYYVREVPRNASDVKASDRMKDSKADSNEKRWSLMMVDVDTLQLAVPKKTGSSGGAAAAPAVAHERRARDYVVECRCFYCHGRSDCLFMNSLEGYRACGQLGGAASRTDAADREDAAETAQLKSSGALRTCTAANDAWFVAQLLYLIGKGSVAWKDQPHAEVVRRLERGLLPQLQSSEPLFDDIVADLFAQRVELNTALVQRMHQLCSKHHCAYRNEASMCPATGETAVGYRSPLLL